MENRQALKRCTHIGVSFFYYAILCVVCISREYAPQKNITVHMKLNRKVLNKQGTKICDTL